jgi:hypothetical protein
MEDKFGKWAMPVAAIGGGAVGGAAGGAFFGLPGLIVGGGIGALLGAKLVFTD